MRTDALDIENRLIEVRDLASGQPLRRSRSDGLSRRRERVQWVDGAGSTNRYVYDTWNVVRVLDGADTVVESYVHGPDLSGSIGGAGGIGGILSVTHEGEVERWRFYHADGNGNIVLLTDETEQETARLEYDPFGRVLINTSGMAVRYQFSSKEYDATVGLNYYGYRFYSAGLGRWVNRDPLGDLASPAWHFAKEEYPARRNGDESRRVRVDVIIKEIELQIMQAGGQLQDDVKALLEQRITEDLVREDVLSAVDDLFTQIHAHVYLFVRNNSLSQIDAYGLWCCCAFKIGCLTCEICGGSDDCGGALGYTGCIRCGKKF